MHLIDLRLEVNTSCWVVICMCFSFFLLVVSCLIMVSLMPCWLVKGHFEHKHLKKGNSKVDWTLRFLNDLELCACLVWVT